MLLRAVRRIILRFTVSTVEATNGQAANPIIWDFFKSLDPIIPGDDPEEGNDGAGKQCEIYH